MACLEWPNNMDKIFATIKTKETCSRVEVCLDVPNEFLLTPVIIRVDNPNFDQEVIEMNISDFMDDIVGGIRDYSKKFRRHSSEIVYQVLSEIADEIHKDHPWREKLTEGTRTELSIQR